MFLFQVIYFQVPWFVFGGVAIHSWFFLANHISHHLRFVEKIKKHNIFPKQIMGFSMGDFYIPMVCKKIREQKNSPSTNQPTARLLSSQVDHGHKDFGYRIL